MPQNKESNFVSAVIYVYNNGIDIEEFFLSIYKHLKDHFLSFEMIIVDDCCSDDSIRIVKDLAKQFQATISILHMGTYQGIERAMNAGRDHAIGDFVLEFDNSILDFDPEIITQVYTHSLEGYDIVSAVPDKLTRNTSKLFYYLFNKYSNTKYHLRTESFRLLSRRAVNRIQSFSYGIPYRKAIYANCGMKQSYVVYTPLENKRRLSRQESHMRKGLAFDSFILFTNMAYRMTAILAIIMMVMTMFSAGYTISVFLREGPVAGWTTTMLLISASFFGVFTILSVIIKYLSVVVNLLFMKQQYIVESFEKIGV